MNNNQDKLGDFLLEKTQAFLTWRKKQKLLVKARAKSRGFVLDFVLSIPSTLLIVFVLNLYFLQAYVIPSGSMEDTLLIGDRILVDKFSYGPEVWLGVQKHFPAVKSVKRGEIITFPNPEYKNKGVLFETTRRILFFVTLTFWDIAKENGQPPVDLLIKRAIGYDGDRVVFRDGNIFIKAEGEKDFLPESYFKFVNTVEYYQKRLHSQEEDQLVYLLAQYRIFRLAGLPTPEHLQSVEDKNQEFSRYSIRIAQANAYPRSIARMQIYPNQQYSLDDYYLQSRGIYVPRGYVLPLGDNRDNSHDGRNFGVVSQNLVQGQAILRFWPFHRIGVI